MPDPVKDVIRAGDTEKAAPFTIGIVANPALERPRGSANFVADPAIGSVAAFQASVQYVEACLFGTLPGQVEKLLADPGIGPKVRLVSLYVADLPLDDANCLVAEDDIDESHMLIARRLPLRDFFRRFQLEVDVGYAISQSPTHTRASAWFTTDDDSGPGTPFSLDGRSLHHRHWCLIPGAIAMHTSANSLTALHEFLHAISSYTNRTITDLYVDSPPALNCKRGPRPIPADFATYDGVTFASDATRDGLGYPPTWQSYHCALHNASVPAVMDNYHAASNPLLCENDQITRQFVKDRLSAKVGR